MVGLSTVDVQVEYNGVRSESLIVPVLEARPGIFSIEGSGRGQAAVTNEDGSPNSAANPARRGSVIAPVRFDPGLRPGLAFLTTHFHEQVATNDLTIDAIDPKSGTSEFKATAIRIEKMQVAPEAEAPSGD